MLVARQADGGAWLTLEVIPEGNNDQFLIEWVTAGDPATYRLADVAEAHRDLEARRTVGSIVLIP